LRSIDNKRLIKRIGELPKEIAELVKENIKIVLDLEE
jgi:mRNA interferase MazF